MLLSVVFATLSPAAIIGGEVPDSIYARSGELLPAACARAELSRIEQETSSAAGKRRPKQAFRLVRTALCGDVSASHYLAMHTTELVATEHYGLDAGDSGPTFTLEPRSTVAPLDKQAWGAFVESQGRDIMVWYRPAGICTGGMRLRYVAGSWLLVGVGVACD